MKIKLRKIQSSHQNLRTSEVIGECLDMPEVGKGFTVIADALSPEADFRCVSTSAVLELMTKSEKVVEFKTVNSHYEVEVLG